jgi:hypothetical protein
MDPLMVALLKLWEMVASAARVIEPVASALPWRLRAPKPVPPGPLRVMALARLSAFVEALAVVERASGCHSDGAGGIGEGNAVGDIEPAVRMKPPEKVLAKPPVRVRRPVPAFAKVPVTGDGSAEGRREAVGADGPGDPRWHADGIAKVAR